MASIPLLAATSDASASAKFVLSIQDVPATIFATGPLAGVESADLQISEDDGTTWLDLAEAGSAVELLVANNVYSIKSPGTYRLDKDASVAAVALWLNKGSGLTL